MLHVSDGCRCAINAQYSLYNSLVCMSTYRMQRSHCTSDMRFCLNAMSASYTNCTTCASMLWLNFLQKSVAKDSVDIFFGEFTKNTVGPNSPPPTHSLDRREGF